LPLKLKIGSIKEITQVCDISTIESLKIVSANTLSKDQLRKAKEELKKEEN
jgi:hypothetical protein